MLKSRGRLLLFAILTLFSLLLSGAAEVDLTMKSDSDGNTAVVNNLLECNTQLYEKADASWREVLHKKPMFMLRIEASAN
ncbi:MAG: hypothetical protein WC082_06045 [Victivallales bacterium]